MSDRDDLVWLIADALAADDPEASCAHNLAPVADAILAAGWVSPDRHQEPLDAMALQVTYTEDGTWDVLRRFREVRAERDSQAETLQRVRDLLLDKFANPDSAYRQAGCAPLHPSADALLRATLDEQEAHA